MKINVYRLYQAAPLEAENEYSPENYIVSLITTDGDARYVYPTRSVTDFGDRIEIMTEAAKRDGNLPKTPEDWADLALYNMGLGVKRVLVLEVPEYANADISEVEANEVALLDEIVIPDMEKARRMRNF